MAHEWSAGVLAGWPGGVSPPFPGAQARDACEPAGGTPAFRWGAPELLSVVGCLSRMAHEWSAGVLAGWPGGVSPPFRERRRGTPASQPAGRRRSAYSGAPELLSVVSCRLSVTHEWSAGVLAGWPGGVSPPFPGAQARDACEPAGGTPAFRSHGSGEK
jgi:hypothetical protein